MSKESLKEKRRGLIYKILDYTWVIVAIIVFVATIKLLNDGTLETKVATLGLWAPIVIIVLKASTLVFAPLGGMPLYIISGVLYGTNKGFLLCFVGDLVGSVICFALSRKFGLNVVKFFAGSQNMDKIRGYLGLLNTTRSFLKARLAFAGIPELLAYAAGLSSVSFWKFVLLHIPLYIPIDFVLVFLGSAIAEFTAKFAILVSLGVFALASIGIWALAKDYRKVEAM